MSRLQSGKGWSRCRALRLETRSSEKGLHTSQRLRLPCHARVHAGVLSPHLTALSSSSLCSLMETHLNLQRSNSVPRVTERGTEARMGDCGACGLPGRSSASDSTSPAHREKMEASREVSMRVLQHLRPFPASEKTKGYVGRRMGNAHCMAKNSQAVPPNYGTQGTMPQGTLGTKQI